MAITAADRAQGKNYAQPVQGPGSNHLKKNIYYICVYVYVHVFVICILYMCVTNANECILHVYIICVYIECYVYIICIYVCFHLYVDIISLWKG